MRDCHLTRLPGHFISLILASITVFSSATASTEPDPRLRQLLEEAVQADYGFKDRFVAEVWLLDMSNRLKQTVKDPEARIDILKQVHYEAARVNVAPELVLAIIEVESAFDEFAISVAGARGLMQVMPFWLDEIGISDKNLFKIRTNLRMGCTILRYYLDMESGNLIRALARYNGSLGKMTYPNKVLEALNTRWFRQ